MKKQKIIKIQTKKGFSLLEVIIALFILSVGIVGMLQLVSISIANSTEARDNVIASQLAQEGIELVRNKRDTNILVGVSDVFDGIDDGDDCRVDVAGNLSCDESDFQLSLVNTSGVEVFLHSSGIATKFRRKIVLDKDSEKVLVKSFVYWGNTDPDSSGSDCNNLNQCIYSETILTDWSS